MENDGIQLAMTDRIRARPPLRCFVLGHWWYPEPERLPTYAQGYCLRCLRCNVLLPLYDPLPPIVPSSISRQFGDIIPAHP